MVYGTSLYKGPEKESNTRCVMITWYQPMQGTREGVQYKMCNDNTVPAYTRDQIRSPIQDM